MFPDNFIALAEESDIIHQIGEWVLNEACRQAAEWQSGNLRKIPIAINFSAFQFRRSNLVQGVASALARHGVKPQQIEIELTENAIMQDPKETAKTLCNWMACRVVTCASLLGAYFSVMSATRSSCNAFRLP